MNNEIDRPAADLNAVGTYLDTMFRGHTGRAHLAFGVGPRRDDNGKYGHDSWVPATYEWPKERDEVMADVATAVDNGWDVYDCPRLMQGDKRTPDGAAHLDVLHADYDRDTPIDMTRVRQLGAVVVDSGTPNHLHLYVRLTESVDAPVFHALESGLRDCLGADNKIAANDVLRLPGTYNMKPTVMSDPPGEPSPVRFVTDPSEVQPMDVDTVASILGVDLSTIAEQPSGRPALRLVGARQSDHASLAAEVLDEAAMIRKSDGNVDRSDDTVRVVNVCASHRLTLDETREMIRVHRPDLQARLDARTDDDVRRIYERGAAVVASRRRAQQRDEEAFLRGYAVGSNVVAVDFAGHHGKRETRSTSTCYELHDSGNADLLVAACSSRLRYCPESGKWMTWDGMRWVAGTDTGVAIVAARKVIESSIPDDGGEQSKHKRRSLSRNALENMVALAACAPEMRLSMSDLDASPYELNTRSGVVNLRTGELSPHDPEGRHTKICGVGYDPTAPLSRWDAFLHSTFDGDQELIGYMQRLAGLAAIGKVTHHVLPFMFGSGGNGKSAMADVLIAIFGDYAITAPSNFLLAGRDKHETEIARLHGARMVVCSEINADSKFDEAKVKVLTGGDVLSGRYMRQDFFDFIPSHTLFLMGNHQPQVSAGGQSFWRRLRLIPFLHSVPPEQRNPNLATDLIREEGAAILGWVVAGARAVEAEGLCEPESVRAATDDYAETTLGDVERFVDEVCDITTSPDQFAYAKDVHRCYQAWAGANGAELMDIRKFGLRLKSVPGVVPLRKGEHGRRYPLHVDASKLPTRQ